MKKPFLFIIVLLAAIGLQQANSQIPDDTDGRLYRLCKTWGYFKYFSQHKCELKWDTLLNTTVNEVLLANSNTDFNNALMNMFNKVGNNSFPDNPGPEPDTNINFDNSWIDDPVFSQPVRDFLDTFSIYIYPDTSTCLVKFNDYLTSGYYSYIDFRDDPLSMPINYINEANRLTTMFYYWNVINYFSPNRNIMDQPWNSTLYEFIPLIRQATTVLEFHITFLKLVTHINDSHDFTTSTVLTNDFWGGNYLPKIYFTRVDTLCVVTKAENIGGVSPGDILTALKGIPIQDIEDSLSLFVPASTPAALYRDIYYQMLRGGYNTTLGLTLSDSNNNTYTVSAIRSQSPSAYYNWMNNTGLTSSYFITACDYGYVNMGMLLPEEVPAMFAMLQDAPAIIFDIRNYPYAWLSDICPFLFPGPIISAIYYEPALTNLPAPYNYYYLPGWYYQGNDYGNVGFWSNPDPYDGNVYILVNQETQSAAEYMCQYLSYHPNAKVIGTQTAGADGNTSDLTLPGGISTSFTSLGWYYADGYQQQRNGVKIDTVVSLTIAGIRQGKDEILETAFDCLIADFVADPTMLCLGDSTQFTDLTIWNPIQWQWTFPGGTPGTSTQQNPQVIYNTQGSYDITLVTSNGIINDSITKTSYITVLPLALQPPGTPVGEDKICINPPNTQYTTTGSSGATGYVWQIIPTDAGVLIGSGPTITVDWEDSFTGVAFMSVKAISNCAESDFSPPLTVTISLLPSAYTVTGGGIYCEGVTGVEIGLEDSDSGVLYELFINSSSTGTIIAGTDSTISFGFHTQTGTYSVTASDTTTTCENQMNNTVEVTEIPLPSAYQVDGGGPYCYGNNGATIYLNDSQTDHTYELYLDDLPTGIMMDGTDYPISFTNVTAVGIYTIMAEENSALCTNMMEGSVEVWVIYDPPISPATPLGPAYVNLFYNIETEYVTEGSSGSVSYEWLFEPSEAGTTTILDSTTLLVTWNINFLGVANLSVRGVNDCGPSSWSDTLAITIDYVVGLDDADNKISACIYPNPNQGVFIVNLHSMKAQNVILKVLNTLGLLIYEETQVNLTGNYYETIKLSGVPDGIYFMKIENVSTVAVHKIIIQKN